MIKKRKRKQKIKIKGYVCITIFQYSPSDMDRNAKSFVIKYLSSGYGIARARVISYIENNINALDNKFIGAMVDLLSY